MVAYPLLRVEIEEVEIEGLRDLPPGFFLLGPASIEPFDLQINGSVSFAKGTVIPDTGSSTKC
jgi:hypothetical protein